MEIVKIDAAEYGLEENKAKQISDMFKPMLDEMTSLEKDYNKVAKMKISEETSVIAKELRLKYVKIRTTTASVHKELKAFYLQGGRFVDGWKNAQLMASQGIEDKLSNIEKHFENIEKERVSKLQEERALEMSKLIDDPDSIPSNLGSMEENVWDNFIKGQKMSFELADKEKKEVEEKRIEDERLEKLEADRVLEISPYKQFVTNKSDVKQNEDLVIEVGNNALPIKVSSDLVITVNDGEKQITNLKSLNQKEYDLVLSSLKDSKIKHDENQEQTRLDNERLKKEAEVKEKEADAAIEKERKEKEEIASKLKAKEDAELETARIEEEQIQSELNKGDADKIKDLVSDLVGIRSKYEFKSKKNKALFSNTQGLIDKVITYIEENKGK